MKKNHTSSKFILLWLKSSVQNKRLQEKHSFPSGIGWDSTPSFMSYTERSCTSDWCYWHLLEDSCKHQQHNFYQSGVVMYCCVVLHFRINSNNFVPLLLSSLIPGSPKKLSKMNKFFPIILYSMTEQVFGKNILNITTSLNTDIKLLSRSLVECNYICQFNISVMP